MKRPIQHIPFTDIELTPTEAAIFDVLLQGIDDTPSVVGAVIRLTRKLKSAMPDTTTRILLAQEFIRRQDAILTEQILATMPNGVSTMTNPYTALDREVEARYKFYDGTRGKAKGVAV